MASIETDSYSADLRPKAIRPETRELLISKIEGSDQEFDLTSPPNAGGYGRIRHFRGEQAAPWPLNPLPVLPAANRLGLDAELTNTAQVFQNAACNWRCWYCYVPFSLLSANEARSGWFTADELVAMYEASDERPLVIDCSGGQPDLVPEWVPWMMDALVAAGLSDQVYLWSDDNLSNDYFWRYLTPVQIEQVATYANYGRVACFKGFDETSFAFNTKADESLFGRQFELFEKLLKTGMDLYAYATLTGPNPSEARAGTILFLDRLQQIDERLPLRLVPLRIEVFGVVERRVHAPERVALETQESAIAVWNEEMEKRFTAEDRALPIPLVEWSAR
ncbi:hypothetical protein [Mesorhizobium japonicum]|uniref:hypothetical protein n=1 Tax=Mesorhizobium japonicum TaxID=2066070 RepID=UPI003B59B637